MGPGAIGISKGLLERHARGVKVNHYQVQEGLFAGEYPGHPSPNVADTRLRELVDRGIVTFIDLTTAADAELGLLPYEPHFAGADESGSLGLKRYSFEIPDMGIPSGPEVMRGVLDLIRSEIEAGRSCYVHCWGGIGRTGTAVACWLREQGMDAEAALAKVQSLYETHMGEAKRARYPRSPQQPAQLRYVREWVR
jgi:hypothetical protein